MSNWQKITATVRKSGLPNYPRHVRINAAYRMLMNAARLQDQNGNAVVAETLRKAALQL